MPPLASKKRNGIARLERWGIYISDCNNIWLGYSVIGSRILVQKGLLA